MKREKDHENEKRKRPQKWKEKELDDVTSADKNEES